MRILDATASRRTPWKNGGGETREIAIFPADATIDSFGWRISMATVAIDGPFSIFPDVDRTLCILDGAGVRLQFDGEAFAVTPGCPPLTFKGERPVSASLIDGPITDFNVMTRRSTHLHHVIRLTLQAGEPHQLRGVSALFCAAGSVNISDASVTTRIGAGSTVFDPGDAAVQSDTPATLLLVTITAN